MKKLSVVLLFVFGVSLLSFSAEAPCGVEKEAERIVALAKSELGIYSGVISPFVFRILDTGGMNAASADSTFDQLAVQAKKDGYNLGNVVANLKKLNRLVLGCREYPEYLKNRKADKELAAKELALKRQARLTALKRQQEEERLAEIEREKAEEERVIQEQIALENERKRQEEEKLEQVRREYQNRLDLKAASLYEGYIVKIPSMLSPGSPTDPSFRGMIGLLSTLTNLGDRYIITLKEMKNVDLQLITAETLFKAIKKRKKYEITLSGDDLLNLEIVARSEKEYFNR